MKKEFSSSVYIVMIIIKWRHTVGERVIQSHFVDDDDSDAESIVNGCVEVKMAKQEKHKVTVVKAASRINTYDLYAVHAEITKKFVVANDGNAGLSCISREGSAKAMVADQISQAVQSASNLLHLIQHSSPTQAQLIKLPKNLLAKILEQMPGVISSLDAHMENGLQKLKSFLLGSIRLC